MTWHCLVLMRPLNRTSGLREDVRIASADLREITGLGGARWEPAMIEPPKLTIELFNGDFKAAVQPGGANIQIAMLRLLKSFPAANDYFWAGAQTTIHAGRITDAWPWQTVFDGTVDGFGRQGETLRLTASVNTAKFDVDALPSTYAGTGAAEGGTDLKGQVKPLVLGLARNAEPVLINAIDSIYQFSGYGPIEAVNTLYERGSDFGAAAGDFASYAALQAAAVAPGTWATCLAEGLVRLGAPAFGVITGDVLGHEVAGATPRRTGAMIKALASIAGIASGDLENTSLDALDAAVPYDVNAVLSEAASFIDAARRLALPCNYQAGVSLIGKFFVAGINLGASQQLTLNARGTALPQVIASAEENVSPPYYRTIMGAERSWRVHSFDEIAFYAPLIDMGLWSAATTYREGNIVTDAAGDKWIYVNPAPSAGNPPGQGSVYWSPFGTNARGIRTFISATEPLPFDVLVGDPATESPSLTMDFGADFVDGDVWFNSGVDTARWNSETFTWDRSLADLTKTVSGPAETILDYDSTGTLTTSLPKNATFKLAPAGGTALTSGVTWAAATRLSGSQVDSDIWSGTSPSIAGTGSGALSVNSGLKVAEAIVDITASVGGVTYPAFSAKVKKVTAPAEISGGGGAGNTFASASLGGIVVTGSSFVTYKSLSVDTDSGSTQVVHTAANVGIDMPPEGPAVSSNIEMKYQWESSPGVWADVDTSANSDPDPFTYFDGGLFNSEPGSITLNRTKTGLSSSTTYNFRLQARVSSGDAARNYLLSGTWSAQG